MGVLWDYLQYQDLRVTTTWVGIGNLLFLREIKTNNNLGNNNNRRDHTLRHRVVLVVLPLITIKKYNTIGEIRKLNLRKETSLFLVGIATNSQVHLQ